MTEQQQRIAILKALALDLRYVTSQETGYQFTRRSSAQSTEPTSTLAPASVPNPIRNNVVAFPCTRTTQSDKRHGEPLGRLILFPSGDEIPKTVGQDSDGRLRQI